MGVEAGPCLRSAPTRILARRALPASDLPRNGGGAARSRSAAATTIHAADAHRGRHHAVDARQGRAAGAAGALARRARRDRALGAAEAGHRRAADRRLGAAGEDRGGGARRQGSARHRAGLARARAALSRAVRLAGRPRRQAGQSRSGAVPAGDAGACDRGRRLRRARPGRLHRRMEMGRHPRAGGERRATSMATSWRGCIRAPARTSPRAFPICCRRCGCPARSTASCWCCATGGCSRSTCCSSG